MQSYISALILSAGASSRMGQPKALLKLSSGRTLLEDQCRRIWECRGDRPVARTRIYVVVGCHAEKIIEVHKHLDVTWVVNKDWEQGRFSSIQCGVKNIGDGPILLLPIDVVGVEVDIIKQIIDEGFSTQSNIVPTFEGKGGHPVFLCGEILKTILETPVEEGRLNQILRESKKTRRVEVESSGILNNDNTPEDWQRVCDKQNLEKKVHIK